MEDRIIDEIKTNVKHRLDLENLRNDEEVRRIIMDEIIRMGKKVRLTPKKGKEDDEIGKLWATGTSR